MKESKLCRTICLFRSHNGGKIFLSLRCMQSLCIGFVFVCPSVRSLFVSSHIRRKTIAVFPLTRPTLFQIPDSAFFYQ